MRTMVAMMALAGMTAGTALAQPADPIAQREALMEQNGKDTKAGAALAKGETPYDPAAAEAIFKRMNAVAMKFGGLFPKGSETGGKTEASPAIWQKPGEFKAALAKFQEDTAAAAAAKPQTVEAFRPLFGQVAGNCKSCHEAFRVKKG